MVPNLPGLIGQHSRRLTKIEQFDKDAEVIIHGLLERVRILEEHMANVNSYLRVKEDQEAAGT